MKRDNRILAVPAVALVCSLLAGCASARWQVHQSEYSYQAAPEDGHYHTQNSILVDTKTGRSWILSPSAEDDPAGYEWIPLVKHGEAQGLKKARTVRVKLANKGE